MRRTAAWILTAAAACGLASLLAGTAHSQQAPTVTARTAARVGADGPRSSPPLELRGRLTRRIAWSRLPTSVVWDGTKAGNINPSLRAVYRGQTLYKLIGLVDDKDPKHFNLALARKGYTIQFICSDGYKPTISSKRIIGKTGWIIAKLKLGKPLPSGEGPYRFVGSFIKPFNGKLSARMIVRIRLIF